MSTLNAGIQLRGNTTANLTSANETFDARRLVIATDTGKIKIGDGSTPWVNLPYVNVLPSQVKTAFCVWIPGKPLVNETLYRTQINNDTAFTIPAGGGNCLGNATTAATANYTIDLKKNGTSNGTLTWVANSTSATISIASAVTFASGDIMSLEANATADATLANVSIVISGNSTL
jgi:hypothetical protein